MSTLEQAARMALEALSHHRNQGRPCVEQSAYDALRAALAAGQAQPVSPVGVLIRGEGGSFRLRVGDFLLALYSMPPGEHPLYASPPARQPLTDEQIADACLYIFQCDHPAEDQYHIAIARAIERAHGIT